MMKKRLFALTCAALMGLSLTACGNGNTPSSTDEGGETPMASGVEDGVLTIAMECAYAPYNWLQDDDSNGAVAIANGTGYANGYDVMMAKKICEANGWELEIYPGRLGLPGARRPVRHL